MVWRVGRAIVDHWAWVISTVRFTYAPKILTMTSITATKRLYIYSPFNYRTRKAWIAIKFAFVSNW